MADNRVLAAAVLSHDSIPQRELLSESILKFPMPIQSGAEVLLLDGGTLVAASEIDKIFEALGPRIPFHRAPLSTLANTLPAARKTKNKRQTAQQQPQPEPQTRDPPQTIQHSSAKAQNQSSSFEPLFEGDEETPTLFGSPSPSMKSPPLPTTTATTTSAALSTPAGATEHYLNNLLEHDIQKLKEAEMALTKMSAKDLKARCQLQTLLTSGTKAELIARLIASMAKTMAPSPTVSAAAHSQHPQSPAKPKRLDLRKYVGSAANERPQARQQLNFRIIVDYRERKSNTSFSDWIESTGLVSCLEAQLPCGDFMFASKDTGLLYPCVVERKTLNDLLGSLITPRFSQQKRLMQAVGLPQNFLILEGNLRPNGPDTANLQADELKRLHSAITTTAAVDGFNVIHCQTQRDTLHTLIAIGTLVSTLYIPSPEATIQQISKFTLATKRVIEMKSVFPTILANLHGCSSDSACDIASEFRTLVDLHKVVMGTNVAANEMEFVKRIQKNKKRQRDAAELSIVLIQLFGKSDYIS